MSITTTTITPEQKQKILSIEEGHFGDLKSVDISPGKLTKSISAFANADGGELFIGVDENTRTGARSWRGFNKIEDANGHIQAFESLFPLGHGFNYAFLESKRAKGKLLHIDILKSQDIVYSNDKIAYLRRGAMSLPQTTPEEIERLKLNKGLTTFETNIVNTDTQYISNSENIIKFMLDVIPTSEPPVWLKKQQLIRDDKPTVAGILLFSDEPQAILPKRCSIKIYRYKTMDEQGSRDTLEFDPITIEGCVYEQIASAVEKTKKIIEGLKVLGVNGLEIVRYPQETLHEVITNAVLHRDYSILDDIHVRIFDNRIEVQSPGKLPAHITTKNILEERFSRNGTIVRIINKFPNPPNKDVGEGLNTAFQAMRKLKLKDPIIEETASSVVIKIRHERLASPEETVLEYLEHHKSINNTAARQICYIGSENIMKRVFERLIITNKIERIPGLKGRATAYRKIMRKTA
jgi:ATP-dependent DNA helicase RecG